MFRNKPLALNRGSKNPYYLNSFLMLYKLLLTQQHKKWISLFT